MDKSWFTRFREMFLNFMVYSWKPFCMHRTLFYQRGRHNNTDIFSISRYLKLICSWYWHILLYHFAQDEFLMNISEFQRDKFRKEETNFYMNKQNSNNNNKQHCLVLRKIISWFMGTSIYILMRFVVWIRPENLTTIRKTVSTCYYWSLVLGLIMWFSH